jgi:hypothetical protein
MASHHGHDQIVQWLLKAETDVNAQSRWYDSPVQQASDRGHDQIVQRVLEVRADVNVQGGDYGSALQMERSWQIFLCLASVSMGRRFAKVAEVDCKYATVES